jgi:hypothetical protein
MQEAAMRTHLCERCYAPIDTATERYTTLAHIQGVEPDGTVRWVHSALHMSPCGAPARERSAAEPADRGDWNPARRALSPAAAAWIARTRVPAK